MVVIQETPTQEIESGAGERSGARSNALLCAALLASGRHLNGKEITTLLEVDAAEVPAAVAALARRLSESRLGIVVEAVAGGWRLVVDPTLNPALTCLLAPPPLPRLSNAALETLALVAYRQPVTRGELESARGASCSSTLETLQERELVKVVGQKDVIGKPLLWATTDRFLLEFGLKSLEDLPELEELETGFLRG